MSERHEQRAAEHEQRVADRWTRSTDGTQLPANPRCPVGDARLTNSSGIECPAVNAATVSPRIGRTVSDPSTPTGKADAATDPVLRDLPVRPFPDGADAAKPTFHYRHVDTERDA